jgi:secondary thiamine-phosphate synthase enzyme
MRQFPVPSFQFPVSSKDWKLTGNWQLATTNWELATGNCQLETDTLPTFTDYLWFNTKSRQEFVRITDQVAAIVKKSGVTDGIALVSAMHITSGVYVNDWEDGLIEDFQVWLEKLAPAGLPYRHHQTGEDNADAHLKRTIMGHQVIVPVTAGKLDLGPWEQIFYAEFDGQRKKRVIVKVMGA